MHIVFLPFAEDMRKLPYQPKQKPTDVSLSILDFSVIQHSLCVCLAHDHVGWVVGCGDGQEQISVMEKIVSKLEFTGFSADAFSNPGPQQLYPHYFSFNTYSLPPWSSLISGVLV
jgi:hypothetical protein